VFDESLSFNYTTFTKATIQLQRYNINYLTNVRRWTTFVHGVKVYFH